MTCALKNQYENLPDWLRKYVGMKKKVGGYTIFLTLWVIMFLGEMSSRDDQADSRDLIKEGVFCDENTNIPAIRPMPLNGMVREQ